MSRAFRDRAMTLLEMLLAAGLMVLLMTLIAQVLVPSLRLVGQSSVRTGLQQEARTALERIERDLRLSSSAGIRVLDAPVALGINRLKPGEFSGTTTWETGIVAYCYRKAERALVRREWQPAAPDPTRPLAIPLSDLRLLANAGYVNDIWLARNATDFRIGRDLAGPITVTLELTVGDPATGQPEKLTLERTVELRNH